MAEFKKILIANRGEIAIRVMRAANEMGKRTVAVYAEEDKLGLHRFKADEAYRIGAGLGPVAAYLSIPEVIRVAKASGADAIHPGYGLLSENPDLVDACEAEGIAFIGPKAETMRRLGDKASARRVAVEAGVPVIPATEVLGDDMDAVRAEAAEVGYPLMLKASWGGGGRGMRPIHGEEELEEKVREGRREAEAAFGNGEGYLEKMIQRARHVEVQILGDAHGNTYHLWERDCTVQRRNQKVVERAPAPYLSDAQRERLCNLGKRICEHVGYQCAGTVEFLMDMDSGEFYFIEVNPRVQVEHTVTEEVTGIDIVRAQILITEGKSLTEATGVASQYDVQLDGHAMQCRVTTEDPANNFIPDYGRITTYRSATGMGIRLDGGTAYSGAVITRFYDSLLTKVTAWAKTPEATIARMDRALREFRIRGVATNIDFVINLLKHPLFLTNQYTTKFIDETPDLFDFRPRRDRATRLLTYVADVTVNGHPETTGRPRPSPDQPPPFTPERLRDAPPDGARQILERDGAKGLADWMLGQDRLLLTDTTMRDGHQSLIATRMRTIDMVRAAPAYATNLPQLFSVECWGGATFDVAYRFLQECPWQRLRVSARGHAEPPDPDAPARLQRRGLHELSRQRRPDLRASGRRVGHRRVPRLRQPQLGREHASRDGCGHRDGQGLRGHRLLYRRPARSRPCEVRLEILCRHGEGTGGGGRACAGPQGHGRPPEARGRARPDRRSEGRGGHPPSTSTPTTPRAWPARRSWRPPTRAWTPPTSRWTRCRATPARRPSGPSWRRSRTSPATPGSTSPPSAGCRTTGSWCGPSTSPSSRGCSRRPRRSTCTRCRAVSSPTSRARPGPWGWRSAGTRWRRCMPT